MKAIKVSIEMDHCCVFTGYFTNYPTPEELLSHTIPAHPGNLDVQAFIRALDSKQWVICYDPYKVIQFVKSFGMLVGRIEMSKVSVFDCVGFDPTRTEFKIDIRGS